MDEPTTETAEQQIHRLASFIMDEVPGEPSQNQGAVDTAIRLLAEVVALREALRELRSTIFRVTETSAESPDYQLDEIRAAARALLVQETPEETNPCA